MKKYPITILSIYGQIFSKKEQALIEKAQCIFGGKALLEQLFSHEKFTQDKQKALHPITSPLEQIFILIENYRQSGKRVLVLADGDALYFGMGASLARRFGAKALRIHAGISIVQRLCAILGLAWDAIRHVSLHGRNTPKHWQDLSVAVFSGKPVCVLTDEHANPARIASFLLARGARNFKMHMGINLGLEGEKIFSLSLAQAAKAEYAVQGGYCTILLIPTKPFIQPTLGIEPTTIMREKNLMTKSTVRATALSLLQIKPWHTLWDIGSGSGAVALEMCALAYEGHVIAVEKNAARIKHMEKNRQRMNSIIMDIYHGDAPQCLVNLPKPQGVFVGGGLSSAHAEDLLSFIYEVLPSGGRVVISCVLLGTLNMVESFFKQRAIPVQIIQLNVSHGSELGQDTRLVPENPIFLVCAVK